MKTSNNKKIIVTSFIGLCLIVLAGIYFLTRQPESEFVPTAAETPSVTDSWNEKTEPDMARSLNDTAKSTQITGAPEDDTQVIVAEDETGSTTNLTNSSTKESSSAEKPTEKPITTEDNTNPETPPTYEDTIPTTKPDAASTSPHADSDTHAGEVFVPGFGWIPKGGETQQDIIDSSGDINKQIGSMGG